MAGQKISLLPPVSQVLSTDMFVISRGGNTYKIYGSYLATTPQFEALTRVVANQSTKAELESVRTSFATATAAANARIDNVASTYTTTSYVNNQIDQTKVYVDDKSRTFANGLSGYVPSPASPQTGNNIVWNGSSWIAQTPPEPIVNNYLLDIASVGSVVWYTDSAAPHGFLVCDGASVSRTIYSELFAVIGTRFGSVDSNHFNLPDLRSQFIRGWDGGKGVDIGRTFGSVQMDSISAHTHGITTTVATNVYTLVDTAVDTDVNFAFNIDVDTDVSTLVATQVDSSVTTLVSTTATTQVTSTGTTSVSSTAVTTVTSNVLTDVVSTVDQGGLTFDVSFPAAHNISVPFLSAVSGGTGTFDLSAGTNYAFSDPSIIATNIGGAGTINGVIAVNSTATSLATSTAITLVTSTATTEINSPANTAATSLANSTAVSLATSTATTQASSVATALWQITATSTGISLATSTAVSLATSLAAVAGVGNETRPRNTALLPCIKYTKMVATIGLTNVLSAYVPRPLSPTTGQCIGYNGSSWTALNGLPLTASLNQFLMWNGTAWVAVDYPSNLTTRYTTSFISTNPTPYLTVANIPPTAKRVTIVFSRVNMNGGATVKLRLGTVLGVVSSNYKGHSTAIGSAGQRYLADSTEFNLFGSITYTSVVPNLIIPATQTITSQYMDATITLTKNGAYSWTFANTGSLEGWSTFGGGSLTLPTDLDRLYIFPNTAEFIEGNVTVHWE